MTTTNTQFRVTIPNHKEYAQSVSFDVNRQDIAKGGLGTVAILNNKLVEGGGLTTNEMLWLR